jgi:broad specificity phosphatase PhoE
LTDKLRRPDLIAIRHFASTLNERKISRGLMRVGIDKDAAKPLLPGIVKILKDHDIHSLISSDLPRAEQSMDLIAKAMPWEMETETTPELETWDVGDMAGKKESETIPMRKRYIKYPEEKPPGGEPFQDWLDQFRPELKDILKRRKAGENLAAIFHGHQVLAAPHILQDEEVDPDKLPALDEDFPPGSTYGLYLDGKQIEIVRLDKKEK